MSSLESEPAVLLFFAGLAQSAESRGQRAGSREQRAEGRGGSAPRSPRSALFAADFTPAVNLHNPSSALISSREVRLPYAFSARYSARAAKSSSAKIESISTVYFSMDRIFFFKKFSPSKILSNVAISPTYCYLAIDYP